MQHAILTRIAATILLLGVVAASVIAHETASSDLAARQATYWLALIAAIGLVGAVLRAEARRLHASRQLLIAR